VADLRTKRGDTFSLSGTRTTDTGNPVDLSNYQIRAQMRAGDALITSFSVTITNAAAGEFVLSAPASTTETWQVTRYSCDIEFTSPGGIVDSSDTFTIQVVPDVTR
jgi:hypothetical protein